MTHRKIKTRKLNYYSWIRVKNRLKRRRRRRNNRIQKRLKNRIQDIHKMKEFKVKHLTILKADYKYENKYRPRLSELIIKKFGRGPYDNQETVREILVFSYKFFCDEFTKTCHKENSVRFYQYILSQHEQSIEIAFFAQPKDLPQGLTLDYIAIYRRILKWILEQACDIPLKDGEKITSHFKDRAEETLNELYFLGDMIFLCATMYAEQDMIEDVADISFDNKNHYIFHHKHHYDLVIQKIRDGYGVHSFKHVVDATAVEDLKVAIQNCFGLKYDYLTTVVNEIHKTNKDKGGQYCGVGWESFPMSVNSMFGADSNQARVLFKGLTIDKSNKLELNDLACRPHTLKRYLYRPILIWKIDGIDYAFVGSNSFRESIIQLTTNAIPWGKAPDEWLQNKCFETYVHSKEDEHDTWLDNEVESRLIREGLHYHRNVTQLKNKKGNISLNMPGVGQIDFIIIDHTFKQIYVVDCKHLQGKYDMISQKNDFSNFCQGDSCYNKQIERKLDFITKNKTILEFHNKDKYGILEPDITDYSISGIFIINTPTFYMFNSDFRIYTVDVFIDLILKRLTDPEFIIFVEDGDNSFTYKINYPYFRKPDYKLLDLL